MPFLKVQSLKKVSESDTGAKSGYPVHAILETKDHTVNHEE